MRALEHFLPELEDITLQWASREIFTLLVRMTHLHFCFRSYRRAETILVNASKQGTTVRGEWPGSPQPFLYPHQLIAP